MWRYHAQTALFKVENERGHVDLSSEDVSFANFTRFLEWAVEVHPELEPELNRWKDRGLYSFEKRFGEKQYFVDELLQAALERNETDAVESIRTLIFEHLTEAIRHYRTDLYYDFIEAVLSQAEPCEVNIVTFNFDYLLVEDFRRGIYFDYRLAFDCQHGREAYCRCDPIRLLKLNGSLDWGICRRCEKLHLYFPNLFKGHYENEQCVVDCGGPISPYIVVPHEDYSGPILALWNEAANVIRQSREITVIGYSFPDYDLRVLELFSDNVCRGTRLTVVDYRPDDPPDRAADLIRDRYGALFPGAESIDVRLSGFAGYVESLKSG